MGTSSGDGRLLRELREMAGVSLGQVVRLTDYTKGHLSRVENGLRPASERLARVYASLRERPDAVAVPPPSRRVAEPWRPVALSYAGEFLRARTARGMSQRDLAEMAGIKHVLVSRIENGHTLGPDYLAIFLDKRFGLNGALLALHVAESNQESRPMEVPGVALLSRVSLARPSDVLETAAVDAAVRLERLRIRRHHVGLAAVVDEVVAEVAGLHAAAAVVSGAHARALRSVEARYAEYLSWLAEQLADLTAMRDWLAVAVQLGSESSDTAIASYAAIREAATALRSNDPETSLHHIQCALANPELPPRLRGIALHRECRARARAGDRTGFSRAMDAYHGFSERTPALPTASSAEWEWGPAWDPESSSARLTEASGLLDLQEFRAAADAFATAMPYTFPDGRESQPSFLHARVCFAIREATAYAHVRDCDRAADVIESFLPVASNESATMRRDLRRLASILSRRRTARLRALAPDVITLARSGRPRACGAGSEASDA
jgi:transcriptional regulator with XRE-family HTH domain